MKLCVPRFGCLVQKALGTFCLLERHLAQVAWSLSVLNLICIPQSTHALDQRRIYPRQAVSPRPGGQERYRFATASVVQKALGT